MKALPIFATKIVEVEVGTVIEDGFGGRIEVTDKQAACKGDTIYVTPATNSRLKESIHAHEEQPRRVPLLRGGAAR